MAERNEVRSENLYVSMTYGGNSLNMAVEHDDDINIVIELLELMNKKRKLNNTKNSLQEVPATG